MGDRARLRRLALPIALGSSSVAILVVAMEILVRLLSEEGKTVLERDLRFGQTYRHGFVGSRYVPEAGRRVALRFNREGFRGPDRRHQKPAGTRRIAILGDSFVAGVGVEEKDHFATLLEERLGRELREPWEVLNFGVSGAGTTQAVLIYEEIARHYRPDLVLLGFFHGNDLADNLLAPSRQPRFVLDGAGELRLVRPGPLRAWIEQQLNARSELYVWLLNKWWQAREARRRGAGAPAPGAAVLDAAPEGEVARAWEATEAMIALLARDVSADGARLVVVGLPAHEQVLEANLAAARSRLPPDRAARADPTYADGRLARLCERLGARHLALRPAFAAAAAPESLFFGGGKDGGYGHWSEAGHALAAQRIGDAVIHAWREVGGQPSRVAAAGAPPGGEP